MRLQYDIPLIDTNEIRKHLSISDAIEIVSSSSDLKTIGEIFLPKERWRKLSEAEENVIFQNGNIFSNIFVGIIKFPESISSKISYLEIGSVTDKAGLAKIVNSSGYQNLIIDLKEYIRDFSLSNESPIFHYPYISNSNQRSTSFNEINDSYVGLHIDNFDKGSLTNRLNSRNRICINLGLHPRSLIFINLSFETLMSIYFKDNPKRDTANVFVDEIYNWFMRTYPFYPIFKLVINPGEAYIAPTENVIHDGNTLNSPGVDIRLTVRGYFSHQIVLNNVNSFLPPKN